MRVIYETTDDCKKCPHNTGKVCLKLGKYLFDICFDEDCPLPTLEMCICMANDKACEEYDEI